ncbi:phosphoribosylformylglycinamidine synthase [Ammoniphilus oxalaticus]|uniref:Phosphoribosylformylglycinamidine synthase subunit PurS n=1 Tax=Ammoniphilus oxalaticus TaxID=66863 RepID=A0A419SD95_9BACL|nr:phosphoribosylformylglycinamidine synthase subunit PurS [Ammoniphilus oxalaticus]RKD21092.1 phosphoribosylformylglycinamidine synthase [Ammoniphilus oxalaticus]
MFKAIVYVTLRESVIDPAGSAVKTSLHSLGHDEVGDVRIGKYIELEINLKDRQAAEERAQEMCQKLLANPAIEDYRYELQEV